MAPSKTRTVKNKHAANKSGTGASKASKRSPSDGVVKPSKKKNAGGKPTATQIKGRTAVSELLKKKKKRTYTDEELGIPKLNMITPIGVEKPRGKKKGKVFVDDRESMNTILAMVQAEKEGQIESKMTRARQMEEIREARRKEAEKKEGERKARLEETKESLRKKRKRPQSSSAGKDEGGDGVKDISLTGSKATRKPKKKVAFSD